MFVYFWYGPTKWLIGIIFSFLFYLILHRALEKKQENGETIELSAEGRPELVEEKEMPVVDCTCFGLPRRYIIAILSGIGFCISFGIRCNLGVAIVSMVNSHTIYRDNKEVIVVSEGGWWGNGSLSSYYLYFSGRFFSHCKARFIKIVFPCLQCQIFSS